MTQLSSENRLLISRVPGALALTAYVGEEVMNALLDTARAEGRLEDMPRRGDPVEPPFGCQPLQKPCIVCEGTGKRTGPYRTCGACNGSKVQ